MAQRTIIPTDKNWVFKQADGETSDFLPVAQFPTNIHLDLMHHKTIPDPFIGKNENDVQWVGEKAWIYKTTFSSPKVNGPKAVLAFDGLDTYATVILNGKQILKTEDMFIPERVDITKLMQNNNDNELEITFESAYLMGKKTVEKYPDHHWGCWNGDASRLAVRKAQYHYVSMTPSSATLSKPCTNKYLFLGMGLGSNPYDMWTLEADQPRDLYLTDFRFVLHHRSRQFIEVCRSDCQSRY